MTHTMRVLVSVRAWGKQRLLNQLRLLQVVGMVHFSSGYGCAEMWSRGSQAALRELHVGVFCSALLRDQIRS